MAPLNQSAVSVGVYTALNVSGLTALVSTRIYDDFPRTPTYPFVSFALDETEARGMGTAELSMLTLRVSALSTSETWAEVETIAAKVKELLKDAALTVSGYQTAGKVFWRESLKLPGGVVNGVPVKEMVVACDVYVEAA